MSACVTERLAQFCVTLRYDDVPAAAVDAAKKALLDTLGVALAACDDRSMLMLLRAYGADAAHGACTVLGTHIVTTAVLAAGLNGYAAHLLDYDDVQQNGAGTHMSAPVLPAALAVAEQRRSSGKQLLTAYIAGFELGCRLGRSGGFCRHLLRRGVAASGVIGHFGAAVAAGKLLALDVVQMKRSLGIAATHASGLTRSFGTFCKAQNVGNAARNGVLSAQLAAQGYTAPEDIFDGPGDFFSIYDARVDGEELMHGLGDEFQIASNTLKLFPCAGQRNPIVEAAVYLAQTHDLQPAEICSAQITIAEGVMHGPNHREPRSGLEAKFSCEYAAAVGLSDRAGGLKQFSDERVADSALAGLVRKIRVNTDSALAPFQTHLSVHTADGRELTHFVPAQKGGHLNPLKWDEVAQKFRANAASVLRPARVEELVRLARDIDACDNIIEFVRACRREA